MGRKPKEIVEGSSSVKKVKKSHISQSETTTRHSKKQEWILKEDAEKQMLNLRLKKLKLKVPFSFSTKTFPPTSLSFSSTSIKSFSKK